MDYRFNAEEWPTLPPPERIRRCRLMADQAQKLAKSTTGTMKMTYLSLAKDWETLAFDIEQNSS
jgi:hypothetical protein